MNKDSYSLYPVILRRDERLIHDILYNLESMLHKRGWAQKVMNNDPTYMKCPEKANRWGNEG